MLAYFREDRIPILSKIVWVPDHPWQSRNSVPPDLSLMSWLSTSRNRRVSNLREGQEIWFYYTQTVCWWCSGGQNSDSVKNSVSSRSSLTKSELCPPGYFIKKLIEKNRRVSNTREGQKIWFYCTTCMLMMFGRTEFRFCQNSESSRSALTESEFCPPEYFIAELIE